MRFETPLVPGRLIKRYKRFLADVVLDTGSVLAGSAVDDGTGVAQYVDNELFGDRVRLLGALEEDGRMRLVIQQQAIEGEPATLEQINDFFTGNGWQRFMANGEVAYFDPERQVAISDTHRGNIILMADGLLAPIDLRVQSLSGALLDYVVKACRG